ncbi:MAG: VPDSG-CTERM sorting domain-containing protein [Vicinamibacterales bacterium]
MTRPNAVLLACVASLVVVAATPALGSTIGTTNTGGGYSQILHYSPIGQTFTAVDSTVISAGFYLNTMNPDWPLDGVTVTLYSGSGFAGSVLAADTEYPLADFIGWHEFYLGGVSVTPGQMYTLGVSVTGGSPYWGAVYALGGDTYPDGYAWVVGDAEQGLDMSFQVTGGAGSVPDAGSTLLLFGIGLVGLRAWRNR